MNRSNRIPEHSLHRAELILRERLGVPIECHSPLLRNVEHVTVEVRIIAHPPTRELMSWIIPLVGRLAADGRILRGYEVSNLDPVGHVIRLRLKGLP